MAHRFQKFIEQNNRCLSFQSPFFEQKKIREKRSLVLNNARLEVGGLSLDYSRQVCLPETSTILWALAETMQLQEQILDFKNGKKNWDQEGRHVLCRDLNHSETKKILERMEGLIHELHERKITDIVNIGMGGSYLGPLMATTALNSHAHTKVRCHFVGNLDESGIQETLKKLTPETTLVLAVSKAFTTEEMLSNFAIAHNWLKTKITPEQIMKNHVLAITAFPERARAISFLPERILTIPKNVGGRYSLWSGVGFAIAAFIGMEKFTEFLSGAYEMDQHFFSAGFSENIPVILALYGIWYVNFLGAQTQAIIPYAEPLCFFSDYLQQLCMESLGKSVTTHGQPIHYATGPVIWGGVGTSTQHTVQQLILQGTLLIPVDFIAIKNRSDISERNAERLQEYVHAQTEALTQGLTVEKSYEALIHSGFSKAEAEKNAPHQAVLGKQPVNLITLDSLSPKNLGALVALYEHKVLVQAMLWDVNPFDQCGVELGKQIANKGRPRL